MSQVFVRSDQLKELIFTTKLRIGEWKVLFAIDGEKDSKILASFLDMEESDVEAKLEKLQGMKLISTGDMSSTTAKESIGENNFNKSEATDDAAVLEAPAEDEHPTDELTDTAALEAEISTDTDQEGDNLDNLAVQEDLDSFVTAEEDLDELEGIDDTNSTDEDLDKLIVNLLDDDDSSSDVDSAETSEFTEDVDLDNEDLEKEFDLGSIFEDEAGESAEIDTETLFEEGAAETQEADAQIPTAEKTVTGHATTGTILVVDDSVVIRKMVEIALENESYNIVSVATGKEALTFLDENTPDLIILDIMLSDVNGLDILKAIKASKEIPVVMLSAKDTPRETSKAKQLGADDFIPKPFKDEELVGKIKELIKQ